MARRRRETLKESTEEAGEKAAREVLEKAAKDVSDSSEDVITAANKRLALEGDVRAAQGKVDAAEAKVDAVRQQVEQADQLVKDAQGQSGRLNNKNEPGFKHGTRIIRTSRQLGKIRDYERQGLEVPTWCSTAEITKLRNQAQDALDSSAEWSRQATIANQTLLTRQERMTALISAVTVE